MRMLSLGITAIALALCAGHTAYSEETEIKPQAPEKIPDTPATETIVQPPAEVQKFDLKITLHQGDIVTTEYTTKMETRSTGTGIDMVSNGTFYGTRVCTVDEVDKEGNYSQTCTVTRIHGEYPGENGETLTFDSDVPTTMTSMSIQSLVFGSGLKEPMKVVISPKGDVVSAQGIGGVQSLSFPKDPVVVGDTWQIRYGEVVLDCALESGDTTRATITASAVNPEGEAAKGTLQATAVIDLATGLLLEEKSVMITSYDTGSGVYSVTTTSEAHQTVSSVQQQPKK